MKNSGEHENIESKVKSEWSSGGTCSFAVFPLAGLEENRGRDDCGGSSSVSVSFHKNRHVLLLFLIPKVSLGFFADETQEELLFCFSSCTRRCDCSHHHLSA